MMTDRMGVIAALLCATAIVAGCRKDEPPSPPGKPAGKPTALIPEKRIRPATAPTNRAAVAVKAAKSRAQAEREALPPADRELMDAIDAAGDGESSERLLALDRKVRASANPDVREAFLDAASFYGQKALGVMSAYLNDPNEDVAHAAMCHFEAALGEIDDDAIKVGAIEAVFSTVNKPELLEFLTMQLNVADEKLAVEAIVRIVASGTEAGVKVAKESYEAVTGEAFTDAKAAEAWLRENYTPPEKED